MALSWTMDKIGSICRTVEDCALVFNAIYGPDGKDQTVYDVPFNYTPDVKLNKLRIGYLKSDFDSVKEGKAFNDSALSVLKRLGATLIPIELPKYPMNDLSIILTAEAGAAFDDLTRGGKDDRARIGWRRMPFLSTNIGSRAVPQTLFCPAEYRC